MLPFGEGILLGAEVFGLLMVIVDLTSTAGRIERAIDRFRERWFVRTTLVTRRAAVGVLRGLWRLAAGRKPPADDNEPFALGCLIGLIAYGLTWAGLLLAKQSGLLDTVLGGLGVWGFVLLPVWAIIGPFVAVAWIALCFALLDLALMRLPLVVLRLADTHPNGTLGGIGLALTVSSSVLQRTLDTCP